MKKYIIGIIATILTIAALASPPAKEETKYVTPTVQTAHITNADDEWAADVTLWACLATFSCTFIVFVISRVYRWNELENNKDELKNPEWPHEKSPQEIMQQMGREIRERVAKEQQTEMDNDIPPSKDYTDLGPRHFPYSRKGNLITQA